MYIINSEGIVYHQHEVLHLIKPQGNARWRVMRYKVGKPTLMICTALRAAMICQACGLDKKILVPKNEDFLSRGYEKDIFRGLHEGFELQHVVSVLDNISIIC